MFFKIFCRITISENFGFIKPYFFLFLESENTKIPAAIIFPQLLLGYIEGCPQAARS